jgi:hypothetical protein
LLLDLKRRGLSVAPELAAADGALGFWKALGEVWPKTREQRCWVLKTANVLNKLPKSQHAKAKRALQAIWMAAKAEAAFDAFIETYAIKYEKAAECLKKDREALLAFYDCPAEQLGALANDKSHRKHLRDRAAQDHPIEGMPLEQDRARHGVQVGRGRTEELAPSRQSQPVAKNHRGCEVHRRARGRRQAGRPSGPNRRRLILQAVTKVSDSSAWQEAHCCARGFDAFPFNLSGGSAPPDSEHTEKQV